MDLAHTISKTSFFVFFNKDYSFYTKNLSIWPKNCVQTIFYNKRFKEFRKNQFFSNIFTFLGVIHQNFEDNLRILANFGKFSVKTQKSTDFAHTFSKNYRFFFLYFLIKIILFTLKIYSFGTKICIQSILYKERCKKFVKINFLVTFLHF